LSTFISVVELDALCKQENQEWPFAEISGSVLELVRRGGLVCVLVAAGGDGGEHGNWASSAAMEWAAASASAADTLACSGWAVAGFCAWRLRGGIH
jgi:hypothetical protein